MDDLALIFSHNNTSPFGMQEKNRETTRKRLHQGEKAAALACIISFSSTTPNTQYSSTAAGFNKNHNSQVLEPLIIPKVEANNAASTISFSPLGSQNYQNVSEHIQFGGSTRIRSEEQAHEHVIAERKRRQKITKLFVSLAALLPGLKKMDKASILEGAAALIKQLRERPDQTVKDQSETKTNNEKAADPAVAKAQNNQNTSFDMSNLPEVEVRSLDKEVLITVCCKQQNMGTIDEIISKIQNLHLTIKTSNFMPFGSTTMHITIVAQMNDEFCETIDHLTEKLRLSILKM